MVRRPGVAPDPLAGQDVWNRGSGLSETSGCPAGARPQPVWPLSVLMTPLSDPKQTQSSCRQDRSRQTRRRRVSVFVDRKSSKRSQGLRATQAPNKKATKSERNGASIVIPQLLGQIRRRPRKGPLFSPSRRRWGGSLEAVLFVHLPDASVIAQASFIYPCSRPSVKRTNCLGTPRS
jgi:hypothetical protein